MHRQLLEHFGVCDLSISEESSRMLTESFAILTGNIINCSIYKALQELIHAFHFFHTDLKLFFVFAATLPGIFFAQQAVRVVPGESLGAT